MRSSGPLLLIKSSGRASKRTIGVLSHTTHECFYFFFGPLIDFQPGKVDNVFAKIIRNEILKLTETYKKLDGVEITKLKGKLPWPINGEIITRFGKYTNPDTKVIIDYDLIEIQPKMNNDEKIVYLTKQIDLSAKL